MGCANGIKPDNPEPVDNESHRSEIEQPFRRRLLQRIKNNISADLYLSPGDRELGHSDRLYWPPPLRQQPQCLKAFTINDNF